jgi:hypothetical protein
LKVIQGTLIASLVGYSVVIPVVLMIIPTILMFLVELLAGGSLQGQPFFFFSFGLSIYVMGGIFILIMAIIIFSNERVFNKDTVKEYSTGRWFKSIVPVVSIIAVLFILSTLLSSVLALESMEEAIMVTAVGIVLLIIFISNWVVVGVPSIIIAGHGRKKTLNLAKVSAIPLVVFIFSFVPLVLSMGYQDGPVDLIVLTYLELLFLVTVSINFSFTIALISKFSGVISRYERPGNVPWMDKFVQQSP